MLANPEAHDLPLCILHDIFRRYLLASQKLLPQASDAVVAAVESAAQLGASMGQSFSTKGNDSNVVHKSRDLKERSSSTTV
jgi:hypothetical protein